MLHDILAELLEIHLVVAVEVALFHQLVNQLFVLGVLLLIGFEDYGQFLSADSSIVVDVEVVKCKFEVVPVVGGRFRQTGRNELVVCQSSVMVHIHIPNDLFYVFVVRVVIVLLEVLRHFFNGQITVFVFVDV